MIDFNKIISAEQTNQSDKYTIENEPISSIELMERASLAFVEEFIKNISNENKIVIFCGTGNNGGDGFAIARLLIRRGYSVSTYLVKFSSNFSSDCEENYRKLNDVRIIENGEDIPLLKENEIVVDAIFGSGLTRVIEASFLIELINEINKSDNDVWSVDCPSGLFCDSPTNSENIVRASTTITFQRPKLSFFLPGFGDYVNNWKVVDIGLDENYIQSQSSNYHYLDTRVEELVKERKKFSHKGNYGHALIIAGSYGKIGAAVLASQTCLQHGVGLLSAYLPACGYSIIQSVVPQAMCITDENERVIENTPDLSIYNAIAIGPGIGKEKCTVKVVEKLLYSYEKPLVIDADALNIISENPDFISKIPQNSILTPHPKEFERLFGATKNSFEQLELLKNKSVEHKLIIILKGAHTAIADPSGNVYFNTTGGPWLAQAGSGDRLTGIITSYLAQGYSPLEASLIGVYYHGKK